MNTKHVKLHFTHMINLHIDYTEQYIDIYVYIYILNAYMQRLFHYSHSEGFMQTLAITQFNTIDL